MNRDLNFVLPQIGNLLGHGFPFRKDYIALTPWAMANISYDIFAIHTVWNQETISEIMKPDTIYITILRDPVELFLSEWDYFEFEAILKTHLDDFVKLNNTKKTKLIQKSGIPQIGENQMLRDLGLPIYSLNNQNAIQKKIEELNRDFHFVMIAEYFDESLVLLKELLCWNFDDIAYLKLNSRNSKAKKKLFTNITKEEVRHSLKSWLLGDYMLYDHFMEKFHNYYIPKIMGNKDLKAEVKVLKQKNTELKDKCVLKTVQESHDINDPKFKLWKENIIGYEMTPECQYYGMKENVFIDVVRNKQTERMKDLYNVTPMGMEALHIQSINDINKKIQEFRIRKLRIP
uniref:Galactosylceramide sulfotransferaselike [Saccoglossus kowalevskii] n=1 Tax=Lepeophtheirus salmonis TaxID=72036 RepID=A0A0K2UCL1_LEPSM